MLQNGDLQMRNFINIVIFLLGLFALVSPVSAKDIYYCVADETTGFAPQENYKRKNYKNQRFNLEVDFENQTMKSEKIWLKDNVKCLSEVYTKTLYCTSIYGSTLAINKETLGFHFSNVFLPDGNMDDISISHGSCEKF